MPWSPFLLVYECFFAEILLFKLNNLPAFSLPSSSSLSFPLPPPPLPSPLSSLEHNYGSLEQRLRAEGRTRARSTQL